MKLHFLNYLLIILFIFSGPVYAKDFPAKSNRLVNDYAGILSSDEVNALERKLIAYYDSTSTQVSIVVIKELNGYEINDYAVQLANAWGIGQSSKNNGVLILVAMQERKTSIQTGYGMEGVLPDAICKRIIEYEIKPSFKRSDYYSGFDLATSAIFKFAQGEYKADHYNKKKKFPTSAIIIAFIVLFLIFRNAGKRYQTIDGKGVSGGGFFPPFIGGGGGFGGGSSGSSFGGFDGGSFGGGGASGSW
jgi:uncharacterized protein